MIRSLVIYMKCMYCIKILVMGVALFLGLNLVSGHVEPTKDEKIIHLINYLTNRLEKGLYSHEVSHIQAVLLWAQRKFEEAIAKWQALLKANPLDLLALKFCHDVCFYIGQLDEVCLYYPKTLRNLDKTHPMYSYILAMYSFTKIELFSYKEGEKLALESLTLNPLNAWATHSMCHVYGMRCDINGGIDFIYRTRADWICSDFLACHIYWHLGLLYLDNNDISMAYQIFAQQVRVRAKRSSSLFHLSDAISLLYRLQISPHLAHYPPPANLPTLHDHERLVQPWAYFWPDWVDLVCDVAAPFAQTHFWPFNDAHMCLLLCTASGLMKRVARALPRDETRDAENCVSLVLNEYLATFRDHTGTSAKNSKGPAAKGGGVVLDPRTIPFIGALCDILTGDAHERCDDVVTLGESLVSLSGLDVAAPNDIDQYDRCTSTSTYHSNFCWLGGSYPQREVFTLVIVVAYLSCKRNSLVCLQKARCLVEGISNARKISPWLTDIVEARENELRTVETSFLQLKDTPIK